MTVTLRLLVALAVAAIAVSCDGGAETRDTTVATTTTSADPTPPERPSRDVRISVVTHGAAAAPFWAVVRRGIDEAARDLGVTVTYRAPDVYEPGRMRELVEVAIADQPDGLVVTLPDARALAPALAQATTAGIPVIAINSGLADFERVGALLYVGQPEGRAALGAGQRMAAAGVRNALCLNHQPGVASLEERCRSFARGLADAGGRSRVLQIPLQAQGSAERDIVEAIEAGDVDGVLALGPGGAKPALAALRTANALGRVKLATFDLDAEILGALEGGDMLFAIDQQPYLQGYLPILFLAHRALYGLLPAEGTVVPTGPNFVTRATAAQVARLTLEGYR